jgi:hypothetical protein
MVVFHDVRELQQALFRANGALRYALIEGQEIESTSTFLAEYILNDPEGNQASYTKGLVSTLPVVDGSPQDLENRYGKAKEIGIDTARQGSIRQDILAGAYHE